MDYIEGDEHNWEKLQTCLPDIPEEWLKQNPENPIYETPVFSKICYVKIQTPQTINQCT
jgi:hypothetical protein